MTISRMTTEQLNNWTESDRMAAESERIEMYMREY